MEKTYECSTCKMEYPRGRIILYCDTENCEEEGCEHGAICGMCVITKSPPGSSVNMEAILSIL